MCENLFIKCCCYCSLPKCYHLRDLLLSCSRSYDQVNITVLFLEFPNNFFDGNPDCIVCKMYTEHNDLGQQLCACTWLQRGKYLYDSFCLDFEISKFCFLTLHLYSVISLKLILVKKIGMHTGTTESKEPTLKP